MRDLGPGDPTRPFLDTDPQELGENKCCFEPLRFEVICYPEVVNYDRVCFSDWARNSLKVVTVHSVLVR